MQKYLLLEVLILLQNLISNYTRPSSINSKADESVENVELDNAEGKAETQKSGTEVEVPTSAGVFVAHQQASRRQARRDRRQASRQVDTQEIEAGENNSSEREEGTEANPEENRWTPRHLFDRIPNLTVIIDLTNTSRYYDKRALLKISPNVEYHKIFTQGHVVPNNQVVKQ